MYKRSVQLLAALLVPMGLAVTATPAQAAGVSSVTVTSGSFGPTYAGYVFAGVDKPAVRFQSENICFYGRPSSKMKVTNNSTATTDSLTSQVTYRDGSFTSSTGSLAQKEYDVIVDQLSSAKYTLRNNATGKTLATVFIKAGRYGFTC